MPYNSREGKSAVVIAATSPRELEIAFSGSRADCAATPSPTSKITHSGARKWLRLGFMVFTPYKNTP